MSWWRPLMDPARQRTRFHGDRMGSRPIDDDGGRLRLIGLELRIRDPAGMTEEIQMIPLEIELTGTGNAALPFFFGPLTLHTSAGDVNIAEVRLPASGL